MSDVIQVKLRDETGTLRMRRLRQAGRIPAVVYGQGKPNVLISLDSRDVDRIIGAGRHILELGGDIKEDALVKDVQWDALGSGAVHLDLARIDAGESVEVSLGVEMRGVAPGTRSGGVIKLMLHEIMIRCPANKLPEHLEVNINELDLDQSITAGDLDLPPAAELMIDPGDVVVSCVAAIVEEDTEEGIEGGMAEPEVIGRKADDDDDDNS